MHLGKLKNEAFIKDYKLYGFSTITQLVDVACDELKRKISQKRRAKWREEAHKEYAKSNPKYVWGSVDGEDFVGN
jgi:hypothetical protein